MISYWYSYYFLSFPFFLDIRITLPPLNLDIEVISVFWITCYSPHSTNITFPFFTWTGKDGLYISIYVQNYYFSNNNLKHLIVQMWVKSYLKKQFSFMPKRQWCLICSFGHIFLGIFIMGLKKINWIANHQVLA